MADLADSVARRYEVLRPHLSEFQRRLWLGAEAAELGSAGVAVPGMLKPVDDSGHIAYDDELHPVSEIEAATKH